MSNLYKRITTSLFHVYKRKDLKEWGTYTLYSTSYLWSLPCYVRHRMVSLVKKQIDNLKESGLLAATKTLYIAVLPLNHQM